MRVRVILNPAANKGRGKQYQEQILAAARPFGGCEVVMTRRRREAIDLAQTAALTGCDVVAAAGGDGTVHEVVNGLHRVPDNRAVLGVIPLGSGNDFAWANGIGTDLDSAVSRLFAGRSRQVDLGQIEDDRGQRRVFDNNFGLGFDAMVVIDTERMARSQGFLMYLWAVLRMLILYGKRPRIRIRFDEEVVTRRVLFLTIGVGPRGGGGFLLVPDAKLDDNLLDSCTVAPMSRLRMATLLPQTFSGAHVGSPYVAIRQNREIEVQADEPLPIHIDGEVFAYPADNVRRVTVSSLPAALRVLV